MITTTTAANSNKERSRCLPTTRVALCGSGKAMGAAAIGIGPGNGTAGGAN